jgi:hypothetical protein
MLRQARWHELAGIAATAAQMSGRYSGETALASTELKGKRLRLVVAPGAPAHWNGGPSCLLPLSWGRT